MKKNFYLALMGAIALTGATGLTSCTDDETVVENVNPTYDPATGEVTTDFVFNVSRSVSSTTRMTAANTQADLGQTFRGIDNGYLMSVKLGTTNDGKVVKAANDVSTTNSKLFFVGNVFTADEAQQSLDGSNVIGKSHKILELSLPTESNTLLFWGKAVKSDGSNADHEQGKVTMSIPQDGNLDNVSFKLHRVVPNPGEEESGYEFGRNAFLQYQDVMAAVMTIIIRSEANIGTTADPQYLGWVDYIEETSDASGTKLQMKEKDPGCPENPPHNMSNLGEILAETYCTFNTIYTNELRAGAGTSIAHMIGDLYAVIMTVASQDTEHLTAEEKNAVKVATAIKDNILEFFDITGGTTASWRGTSHIITAITSKGYLSADQMNLIKDAQANTTYSFQNFPTYFHLPKGATILQFVKETTYTAAGAAAYNATLVGARNTTDEKEPAVYYVAGDEIPEGKQIGDEKTPAVYYTQEECDAYNATLTGAVTSDVPKKDARGNFVYKYQYMGSVPTYAMGGATTAGSGNAAFDPKNYVYPPELCYFGNSPLRVTNDTHIASDYPDGPSAWTNNSSWASGAAAGTTGWKTPGHVLSTTRSVAMRDNINYGTALLETNIKYGVDVLKDNNHAIQERNTGANEPDNEINVASSTPFKLTGVLVGGQEPVVGWNYLPINDSFGSMVYDRLGNNAPIIPANGTTYYTAEEATEYNTANSLSEGDAGYVTAGDVKAVSTGTNCSSVYTLVWDNWEEANRDGSQRVVYLALEFENNSGRDFWGQNNLIRNGETFYITAKLDPDAGLSTSDLSAGIEWPSDDAPYALPPYDADGKTLKQRRVFIQDYKTVANLKFTEKSLQHALVAMPDLRSAQISLGLSVDLSWSKGLTFNDVELGKQ